MQKPEVQDIEERFIHFLRENNYRVTRERLQILHAVLHRTDHFTADQLYADLLQQNIRIARATVYSTLELLTDCGILMKNQFERSARYELADKLPEHDHLICTECGHIEEFQENVLLELQNKVCESLGFIPLKHSLHIFAVCSNPEQCTNRTETEKKSSH